MESQKQHFESLLAISPVAIVMPDLDAEVTCNELTPPALARQQILGTGQNPNQILTCECGSEGETLLWGDSEF
jgi:hypothetical protein